MLSFFTLYTAAAFIEYHCCLFRVYFCFPSSSLFGFTTTSSLSSLRGGCSLAYSWIDIETVPRLQPSSAALLWALIWLLHSQRTVSVREIWVASSGVAYWPALFAKLLETVGSRGGGAAVTVGGGPFLLQLRHLASMSSTFACFLLSCPARFWSCPPWLDQAIMEKVFFCCWLPHDHLLEPLLLSTCSKASASPFYMPLLLLQRDGVSCFNVLNLPCWEGELLIEEGNRPSLEGKLTGLHLNPLFIYLPPFSRVKKKATNACKRSCSKRNLDSSLPKAPWEKICAEILLWTVAEAIGGIFFHRLHSEKTTFVLECALKNQRAICFL